MSKLNAAALAVLAAVLATLGACKGPANSEPGDGGNGFGVKDPAWAENYYNATYRVFPNAPEDGILTYPWGSGTNNCFDQNAPASYWNGKGHNHRYPDLFHFANGNKVQNIADWENRRKEISAILQYYMHGRMPSIDPAVIDISWEDDGNTCIIKIVHVESGREATFNVAHTPPAGATAGAKNGILLFGVGMPPAARSGWGTAAFQTTWGGSESNRSGTCATLYGLNTNAADTPSVNMEYAWAMSVILTVIEEGGLGAYYNPAKIGVYGFSRWGKAAMIIGAFAEGRRGTQMSFTFIGSAGSGGPALDRWINQMGYLGHTKDPLPTSGAGATAFEDLKGSEWFMKDLDNDDHGATTAVQAVRGWASTTSGIRPPIVFMMSRTTGSEIPALPKIGAGYRCWPRRAQKQRAGLAHVSRNCRTSMWGSSWIRIQLTV